MQEGSFGGCRTVLFLFESDIDKAGGKDYFNIK